MDVSRGMATTRREEAELLEGSREAWPAAGVVLLEPCIEGAASDEDLARQAIAGQGLLRRELRELAKRPHRQRAVAGECLETQQRIQRHADDDLIGQDPADLGGVAASCEPRFSRVASTPIPLRLPIVLSAHQEPRLTRRGYGASLRREE